jgi:hypothetical protein
MSVGPVGPGGGIYSIIEDVVCKVYLQKTDLEPNSSGYMQFFFLSLGPVGPRGGGIYSIIEDVVCQAYVLRTGLKPNNCGYESFSDVGES